MNHWSWHNCLIHLENGYITGFSDDGIWEGPFQYRLMGFSLLPADLCPRPYFVNIDRRTKSLGPDHCINNRNIAQIQLEYVRGVFDAYPKKLKFLVSFNGKVYKEHFKLSIIGFLRLPCPTGNIFCVFPYSYRNTCWRSGEWEIEVETGACMTSVSTLEIQHIPAPCTIEMFQNQSN